MAGDTMSNGAATAGSNRLVDSDADLDPSSYSLEKFTLYETRARYYLVGRDKSKQHWRVLKIDRSEPADLSMCEDPVVYTQSECNILLKRIAEGNKSTGGLTLVTKAYGIVGFMKFLESYYMILVTKRRQVGTLCGHAIYAIEENQLIAVPHQSVQTDIALSKAEIRYKKLLLGVDLTKDFFFSYTYRMMQSVQRNVLTKDDDHMPYENMFVWNAFLTRDIRQRLNNTRWTIPLIHGFFEQAKLSTFGRIFVITLISRRSRHFAGTRYLKRGVNDRGRVANDVETEQVVVDEESEIGSPSGQISSVVQVRGSIPLFWSQEASRLSAKPDIILQRFDPVYHATKLHFQDLANRYGNPIIILNLIKTVEKRPREMMLRREFANAVGYLNSILPEDSRLEFIHWDFHKFAKSKSANVLAVLGGVASQALDLTGVYYSGKPFVSKRRTQQRRMSASSTDSMSGSISPLRDHRPTLDLEYNSASLDSSSGRSFRDEEKKRINKVNNKREPRFQSGVLRTNCIDCLDRTNVAQYAYGLAALGRQLYAVGLTDTPQLDLDGGVAAALMDLYHNMGDVLALQYGGSAAHNTVFPERQGKWKATTQSREILNSIKRYYSNTYTDGDKQDAINLFLGHFQPQEGKPALWELDSDYYLHVAGYGDEFPRDDKKLLENSGTEVVTPQQNINGALSAVTQRQEDYHSMKLTSFDKLLQVTCGSLKNVRMYGESEQRNRLFGAATGTAPDAAEIQLKSPNWLFGQRKQDQQTCADTAQSARPKKPEDQMRQEFGELDWLSASGPYAEEELYNRYLNQVSSDFDAWYGTGLLPGSVGESDANQHYIQCCQGPDLNLVDLDMSKGTDYTNAVAEVAEGVDDEMVKWAMESALDQFQDIGGDPCTILPKTNP